ncbi:hypothetical protein D187_006739 [Cystobacter fuscus DSM 2262]|uniref:Uncharacterized protein n=1 Tax=Cystobacter fuscus (strain ATCC 25194 / DSM 2262 / NBRC 100088 / M29) TaxID=1242864 RepID=S9NXN4_CYSF2|nr:hypothetical protein D187_006739 [Cystobacter fuscus DSM 2262]
MGGARPWSAAAVMQAKWRLGSLSGEGAWMTRSTWGLPATVSLITGAPE